MNLKKIEEERRALVSRLRTLCLRERILGGTVTRTMVGNSLRMTVTDRVARRRCLAGTRTGRRCAGCSGP